MTTYVALLRAVNLGPHNKIAMSDLRRFLTGLGMHHVQTLLQSGNAVFQSSGRASAQLELAIEEAVSAQLHLETAVLIRSQAEWKRMIARNPFAREAREDPSHLLAVPLKEAPSRGAAEALQKAIAGRELVRVDGRCAYVVYPDGIGRSKLTSALIEKTLGTQGTGRNWNTVVKLDALADSMP